MITNRYIAFLRDHFRLAWTGVHGSPHWARVRVNGLLLAEQTGADAQVVEVFAFIHDVERVDDGIDVEHGLRAAQLARIINDEFFQLTPPQLALLVKACAGHSEGKVEADISVQTCWDADRLDIGRVGYMPLVEKLCTAAAKQSTMIDWAYRRSLL